MPPKPHPKNNSQVYIILSPTHNIDSVHATLSSANARIAEVPSLNLKIETQILLGGNITSTSSDATTSVKPEKAEKAKKEEEQEDKKPTTKPPPPKPTHIKPSESDSDTKPSKPIPAPKPTKSAAEQRALNASKPPKPHPDADLPAHISALLSNGGDFFKGLNVVVSGVPPKYGRKNVERLVEAFGGHLTKSLSKNTGWGVLGNDAGPTKLEKIEQLGLKTLDEDELVEALEKSQGGAVKRSASSDGVKDEDEEEEEDEKPKGKGKAIAKRQKK